MKDLFGNSIEINSTGKNKVNPCIAAFGKGPDGSRCKTCVHLFGKSFAKTYYKCDLRKNSNGPATDHRVNFPACGKYEENKESN